MLRSLNELLGYEIHAKDGQIGKVHNFLFNDEDWVVRYLVVDTGPWTFGRRVLITLAALSQPVQASGTFLVELARDQIKASPDVDLAKPISRQYEEELHRHYHLPEYWGMSIAMHGHPVYIPPGIFSEEETDKGKTKKSHLRSINEIGGYHIKANNGESAGTVTDFIVQDDKWQLRYLVVDVSNQLESDKQVLVAIEWLKSINVGRQEISTGLSQDAIEYSPAYDPALPINRQIEEILYDYHGHPEHWQAVR